MSPSKLKLKVKNSDDVTVTLTDADGNGVEGYTVTVKLNTVSKRRINISSESEVTDENGEAVFTVTAKKKGNAEITFEADGLSTGLKVKVRK